MQHAVGYRLVVVLLLLPVAVLLPVVVELAEKWNRQRL
jgi:hypothetical protein